jgi:hypothetical protein
VMTSTFDDAALFFGRRGAPSLMVDAVSMAAVSAVDRQVTVMMDDTDDDTRASA